MKISINLLNLLLIAINNNEKICILGDYDVDGSAATSLFVKFLESINHPFFIIYLTGKKMAMVLPKNYSKN